MEILDKILLETTSQTKKRHICVTAWLALIITLNSLIAIIYLLVGDKIYLALPGHFYDNTRLMQLTIISILKVVCSLMIFQWKKIGFWGLIIMSIGGCVFNFTNLVGNCLSIMGLVEVAVLYGVLQIKKGNASAWTHLK